MFTLPTGAGKGLAHGTPVLTPDGYRPIEEISVGDSVIGSSGSPCSVIGVYPQGELDVYRVTFNDDTSVLVDAGHLWRVKNFRNTKNWATLTTRSLLARGVRDGYGNASWCIPMVRPVEFENQVEALPVHPYLLGVILGDGAIKHHATPNVTTTDPWIVEKIKETMPVGMRISHDGKIGYRLAGETRRGGNPLADAIKQLGLRGKGSFDKFIPKQYLTASVEDRLMMIRGLMDTDGTLDSGKSGAAKKCEYSTCSDDLADGMEFLVQSLGGTATRRTRISASGKKSHRVYVKMSQCPFWLPRKADKWIKHSKYPPNRIIESIKYEGKREVTCIRVDADDRLFVTDKFIVTHNTILAVRLCEMALDKFRRVLIVTNRRILVDQMAARSEHYGVDHGIIMAGFPGHSAKSIQIASLQTLFARYMHDKTGKPNGRELPDADLCIIDECHQEVERYKELMTYYQHAVIIGLTATPINSEGLALVPPYQYMLEGCTNSELIGDGLLLKTKMFAPSEPDIAGVSITNGKEYNQSALGRAVQECTVFADVMKEWMPYFDRKTVCFVPGVAFGRDLERQFNQRFGEGFCHLVTAKTSQKDRERIFDAVGGGSSRMLISVDVLREGFDLPEISCMIDLQPNNQFRSYWQKVGRIKRSFPGQDYAVCLDLAGNCYKFLHPDEDPQWPEGEESSWEVILRQRSEKKDPEPIICPACDAMRSRGNKCPNCGHEGYTPYRRVRMKDGKLVEVPIEKRQKIAKSREQVLMDRWKSCLFTGLHSNMRLSQCARMFAQKYPDSGSLQPHWPGVEENGSIKWKRRVRDVFTPAKIMEAFGRAAEQATKATEM